MCFDTHIHRILFLRFLRGSFGWRRCWKVKCHCREPGEPQPSGVAGGSIGAKIRLWQPHYSNPYFEIGLCSSMIESKVSARCE